MIEDEYLLLVIAVITLVLKTPSAEKVFKSAWIPAPPPESEPAIVNAAQFSIIFMIHIIKNKSCSVNYFLPPAARGGAFWKNCPPWTPLQKLFIKAPQGGILSIKKQKPVKKLTFFLTNGKIFRQLKKGKYWNNNRQASWNFLYYYIWHWNCLVKSEIKMIIGDDAVVNKLKVHLKKQNSE